MSLETQINPMLNHIVLKWKWMKKKWASPVSTSQGY